MDKDNKKTAIIIGAGPAGLTAAYELLKQSDIKPIIIETSQEIGGISRTVKYKGNKIDIGGHRFFSKTHVIMKWWQNILLIQGKPARDDAKLGRNIADMINDISEKGEFDVNKLPDPEKDDLVMLVRNRCSRIYYLRKFFDYPIRLQVKTIKNLGIQKIIMMGLSYLYFLVFPIKKEKSLEDFFINRFGKRLYETFFKDYTHKVWGVPCSEIEPSWGGQRIKGLTIGKTVLHAIKNSVASDKSLYQKGVDTTLIGTFMYPKYGAGQLWERVAELIIEKGGKILFNQKVISVKQEKNKIVNVKSQNRKNNEITEYTGDYFFSSMPLKDLVLSIKPSVDRKVKKVAEGLKYRDFITIGLLLKKMKIQNETNQKTINNIIADNWIYIQEKDVKLGRLQIFNNWSPYLVADENTVWLGLEYFCQEGDELWRKKDTELSEFAASELEKINIISKKDILDSLVIRVPKAYPAYFGTFNDLGIVRDYLNNIDNLFPIGRNGMHQYNNMDHSMLTAILSVKTIITGKGTKKNVWKVNTDGEYHEVSATNILQKNWSEKSSPLYSLKIGPL